MTSTPLTAPGWPRPRHNGYPIPWVALPDNLGKTDGDRLIETREKMLCQVCGEAHEPDAEVVVFIDGGLRSKRPAATVTPEDRANILIRAMDDAIMHDRCARLAAGSCPRLKQAQRDEEFFAFKGPLFAIAEYESPESEHDPERRATFTYLALDGEHAEVFEL